MFYEGPVRFIVFLKYIIDVPLLQHALKCKNRNHRITIVETIDEKCLLEIVEMLIVCH